MNNEPMRAMALSAAARANILKNAEAEAARLKEQNAMLDETGISRDMLDAMLNTIAEGLTTGGTDMRSLMYCAFRNARKIQKEQKEQEDGGRFTVVGTYSDNGQRYAEAVEASSAANAERDVCERVEGLVVAAVFRGDLNPVR